MDKRPYNPLDYENLTVNLVRELMARETSPLPPPESFRGPGVYALFYKGDFEPYAAVKSSGSTMPIYVGKAVPPGARKGGDGEDLTSRALFSRLREHGRSIKAAENLELLDFRCRYLTVVPLWITMAERFLIEHYRPVWNVCLEGFGIHAPGEGRRAGEISWWDCLHPGRAFASLLQQTKTRDQTLARLREFFESRPKPESL